jgi:hypothetical protein
MILNFVLTKPNPRGAAAVVSPVKVTLIPAKDGEGTDEDVTPVRVAEEAAPPRFRRPALWVREMLGGRRGL